MLGFILDTTFFFFLTVFVHFHLDHWLFSPDRLVLSRRRLEFIDFSLQFARENPSFT